MSLYIIGDVHGCIQKLEQCLARIGFNPQTDRLWSVGDLVGKGPGSLEVLKLVDSLGDSFSMVLGNHEIRLIGWLAGADGPVKAPLQPILNDVGSVNWKSWLRQKPLMLREPQLNLTMSHAGIFPGWSVSQAERYAYQASQQLHLASDEWLKTLTVSPYHSVMAGYSRWRSIIHAFTEMRYCDLSDPDQPVLDFTAKLPNTASTVLKPWFDVWPTQSQQWVFGHWSDLLGETGRADIRCLDTGCVYGRELGVVQAAKEGLINV